MSEANCPGRRERSVIADRRAFSHNIPAYVIHRSEEICLARVCDDWHDIFSAIENDRYSDADPVSAFH
jgi:hypothetical protein